MASPIAIAKSFPAALLLAFTLLGSCDSSSGSPNEPTPEISRTGEKSIVLDVGDLALLPDNAFVTFADGSKVTVTVRDSSNGDIAFNVKLDKAPGDDEQLTLHLSSYGLVTTAVKCVMNANGELESIGSIIRDTMALTIVRRLDGTTYPKTADGAIQAYADALLRDQDLFQPYPGKFPIGLDTAKVRVQVLRRAAKLSQPLSKTAEEWGLPLSYQDARTQILALDPRISSSDSAILFPAVDKQGPVIKLVSPHADTTVDHSVSSLDVVVSASDSSGLDSVIIRGGAASKNDDGNWHRSVSLDTAGSTTTIVVVAIDRAGNSSRDSVRIVRKAVPVAPSPSIHIVSPDPTKETILPFDSSSLLVKWTISIVGDIAEGGVTITGSSPTRVSDSTWQAVVPVPPTGSPNTIAVTARTKAGKTIAESFTASRRRDSVPPRIERRAGSRTVPADSGSALASWFVTDNHKLDIVLVRGTSVKLDSAGSYSAKVDLVDSVNRVEIVAIDSFGNRSRDTIVLVRGARIGPPEDSKPTLTLLSPETKTGQILPFDSGSVVVRWKIADVFGLGSDAVTIDGKSATKESDSVWSLRVPLSPTGTATTISVSAVNVKGNRASDSVSIARRRDTIPPVARPRSSNPDTVSFDVASATVGWTVTDNHKIASVTINGQPVAAAGGNDFASTIPLLLGANKVVLVATDSMGNTTRDSAIVTRGSDTTPPVATFKDSSKSITLAYEITSIDLRWTVTDNHKVASVTIDGKPVTPTAGIYGATIAITQLGKTTVRLVAKDSTGNTTTDSVTITRALGTIPDLILSHATGVYDTVLHVSIKSSVAGAAIKYTLDGTDPTISGIEYVDGATILIDQTRTLKAFATASNHTPSSIRTVIYTMKLPVPAFSLPAGTSADSMFTVNLSSRINGVTFHYTTDGSTPVVGVARTTTTGIILVDSIRTLKVIATKAGWSNSEVISGKFNANIPITVYVGMGGSKVIRADGSLWSTGKADGLADGSVADRTTFEKVRSGVRAVDAGLMLTTSGDLFAYGNRYGSTTVPMLLASGISGMASGVEPSAMLLKANGDMYALGSNRVGQLCTGNSADVTIPMKVASGVKDVGVSCTSTRGSYYCRSIYVTTSGSAFGCGSSIGVTQANPALPTQVPGTGYASTSLFGDVVAGGTPAKATLLNSTGILMDLALTTDGPVWTEVRTGTLKAIPGASLYSLEQYGWLYSLAPGANPATDWKLVSNLIADFATDGSTDFFIKTDGTLWASGTNAGKYGDGTTTSSTTMKRIHLPN